MKLFMFTAQGEEGGYYKHLIAARSMDEARAIYYTEETSAETEYAAGSEITMPTEPSVIWTSEDGV